MFMSEAQDSHALTLKVGVAKLFKHTHTPETCNDQCIAMYSAIVCSQNYA